MTTGNSIVASQDVENDIKSPFPTLSDRIISRHCHFQAQVSPVNEFGLRPLFSFAFSLLSRSGTSAMIGLSCHRMNAWRISNLIAKLKINFFLFHRRFL